jgi:hypothetical protein
VAALHQVSGGEHPDRQPTVAFRSSGLLMPDQHSEKHVTWAFFGTDHIGTPINDL